MPNLDAFSSIFDNEAYRYAAHLGTLPEVIRFSRFVNMATVPDSLTVITFDGSGIGAYTDVREGLTLRVFHQNTSTVKGILRVAAGGATTNTIQVNEVAKQTVDVRDNDRFEVVDEYRVWDVLVSATSLFLKDSRITYTDQLEELAPIATAGGPWFGFHDRGQVYATVPFDASGSYTIDRSSSGTKTYLWDVGDGTITVGSTTTAAITVRVPVGFRHVTLTVTDSSNSKSATIYVPVRVYNHTTDRPLSVFVEDDESDDDNGTNFSVDASAADAVIVAALRHGAFAALFMEEWHGETLGSYGNAVEGRAHMKGCGYFSSQTIEIDAESDSVRFEILGPLAILKDTPALPQLMIYSNNPASWQDVEGLTLWLALWYIIRWGSSTFSYFDFYFPDGISYLYRRIGVDGGTIFDQLENIAKSFCAKIRADRLGRILIQRSPNYMTTAERNARTITRNLTTAGIVRVRITQTHRKKVRTVNGEGLTIAEQPVYSRAPHVPGPGTVIETLESQVVISQSEIDDRTGHKAAEIDGSYYDESTGVIRDVPMGVELEVLDSDDHYDPGLGEYTVFILPASTNKCGISFSSADRWLLRSRRASYDEDTQEKTIILTLDHETKGRAGTAQAKKIEPEEPPIDFDDPQFDPGLIEVAPPVAAPPLVTVGIGIGRYLAWSTVGPYAARVTSPDGFITPANYVYTDISAGLTGKCVLAHVNPQQFAQFYVITTEGLFRGYPLADPFTGWSLVADNDTIWGDATAVSGNIRLSINRAGWLILRSGDMTAACADINANPNSWVRIGINGGTWSTSVFGGGLFPNLNNAGSKGHLYTSEGGYPTTGRVWRNTTWGLSGTWGVTLYATMGGVVGTDVVAPFKRLSGAPNLPNDTVSLVYGCGVSGTGNSSLIYLDNGSAVDIAETELHRTIRLGGESQRGLCVSDEDPRCVYTGVQLVISSGGNVYAMTVAFADDADAFVWNNPLITYTAANFANSYPVYGITLNPANKQYAMLYMAGFGLAGAGWDTNGGGLAATADKGVTSVNLMTPELEAILGGTTVAYAQAA